MYNIDSWPELLSQSLSGGKYNKNVEELQSILTKLGFNPKGIDGRFGDNTRAAVINFQKSRNISIDGDVGPQTRGEIKKALNVAENTSPPAQDVKINFKQISYNRTITSRKKIDYIVVHDTKNNSVGTNAEMHYRWFNLANRNASADFFVDSTQILQINDYFKYYSWHSMNRTGHAANNQNSIGIEICLNSDGNYDVAVSKTIELVRHLMKKLNIPISRVVRHYDIQGKDCPYSMSANNWDKWNQFITDIQKTPPQTYIENESVSQTNTISHDYATSFNIKEKKIEANSGYLIFFDNVRVDQFVKSFDTRIAKDGSIGTANIEMIYLPDFYKIETRSEDGKLVSSMDGIEHMTNVKIFIKNMFNGRYVMVFDGNIKAKRRSRTAHGYAMSFSAVDYMAWLNKTLVPLALGFQETITGGSRLRWLAQGVNIDRIDKVSTQADNAFRGKTIEEFIGSMLERTINGNAIYSEANTAGYWDNASDRVRIMGDISDELIQQKIIDFVVSASDTAVNSMYVAINDIALNLMLEFFQDRDGLIRLKPPFWNQKVLKDHIIDPLLIISSAENTDWSSEVTRVVVTGGAEEYQEDLSDFQKSMLVPSGALIGSKTPGQEKWSHYYNLNETEANENLLRPSTEERKYGVSVYSTMQPMIKFSNSAAFNKDDALDILQKYAKFLYDFLNSGVETAPVTTVAMPWIRPGFNVWLDPVSSDKIYYVNSVTHTGSAEGGVYTSLDLSMGRDRVTFASQSSKNIADNMFVSVFHQTSEDFGEVIKSADEFEQIRDKCLKFYQSDDPSVVKAHASPYFNYFYGVNNYDKKHTGEGTVNSVAREMAKTVPQEDISEALDYLFTEPSFGISIRFGEDHIEIKYAQQRLISMGLLEENKVKKFGKYCEETLKSLKVFNSDYVRGGTQTFFSEKEGWIFSLYLAEELYKAARVNANINDGEYKGPKGSISGGGYAPGMLMGQ